MAMRLDVLDIEPKCRFETHFWILVFYGNLISFWPESNDLHTCTCNLFIYSKKFVQKMTTILVIRSRKDKNCLDNGSDLRRIVQLVGGVI